MSKNNYQKPTHSGVTSNIANTARTHHTVNTRQEIADPKKDRCEESVGVQKKAAASKSVIVYGGIHPLRSKAVDKEGRIKFGAVSSSARRSARRSAAQRDDEQSPHQSAADVMSGKAVDLSRKAVVLTRSAAGKAAILGGKRIFCAVQNSIRKRHGMVPIHKVKTRLSERLSRLSLNLANKSKAAMKGRAVRYGVNLREMAKQGVKNAAKNDGPATKPESSASDTLHDRTVDAASLAARGVRFTFKKAVKAYQNRRAQKHIKTAINASSRAAHAQASVSAARLSSATRTVKGVNAAGSGFNSSAAVMKSGASAYTKSLATSTAAKKAAVSSGARSSNVLVRAGKAIGRGIGRLARLAFLNLKALLTMLTSGGWLLMALIIAAGVVIALFASPMGVFFAGDVNSVINDDGYTTTIEPNPFSKAVSALDAERAAEIQAEIDSIINRVSHDACEIEYALENDYSTNAMLGSANWRDIITVFSVDLQRQGRSSIEFKEDDIDQLRQFFDDMSDYNVSYSTRSETTTVPGIDEDGNPTEIEVTTVTLMITVTSTGMDYREAGEQYGFSESDIAIAEEMMSDEYNAFWLSILGYGFDGGILILNPNLPPNSLGAMILKAAEKYIGYSYSQMDCSDFVETVYRDVGITSLRGMTAAAMAKHCHDTGVLFTDPSQLQPGDIIFYTQHSPRGPEYCGNSRCSGKCRRWNKVHHVGIYIDEQYLIDSVGGSYSVKVRKHGYLNSSKWHESFYGRPIS